MNRKLRKYFIMFVLTFIHFLFAFKYFNRFTGHGLMLSVIYITLVGCILYVLSKQHWSWVSNHLMYWGFVIAYAGLYFIVFAHLKASQLNVDRWSVISSFWDNTFLGKYPYAAQSHMGNYPGPFPMYFVLSLPFYLAHEIGYLSLLGFIGLAWIIRKNTTPKDSFILLVLLVISVPVFWEITVRSTILANAVLFLGYLLWLTKTDLNKKSNLLITAIAGGLVLSTRSMFAFILVIYVVYMLKSKHLAFKRLVIWSVLLLITFVLTFIPFLAFFYHDFLRINPFIVQSDFLLPTGYVPILLGLAAIAGILCNNVKEMYWWIGLVFFSVFMVYVIRLCIIHGLANAYLNSIVDLSYILFSFPFLIMSLFTSNNDTNRS